jgi:hypothetical protein
MDLVFDVDARYSGCLELAHATHGDCPRRARHGRDGEIPLRAVIIFGVTRQAPFEMIL